MCILIHQINIWVSAEAMSLNSHPVTLKQPCAGCIYIRVSAPIRRSQVQRPFFPTLKSQWSSAGLPNQAAFHVGFRTSVYLLGASILLFIWAPSSSPCIIINASGAPLSMLSLEEKSGNCLRAQPFWRWVTFRGHLIDSHILIMRVSARLRSLVPTIIWGEAGLTGGIEIVLE